MKTQARLIKKVRNLKKQVEELEARLVNCKYNTRVLQQEVERCKKAQAALVAKYDRLFGYKVTCVREDYSDLLRACVQIERPAIKHIVDRRVLVMDIAQQLAAHILG